MWNMEDVRRTPPSGITHQCVALAAALAGSRHRHGAGQVFAGRGAAGPAGHRQLAASEAQIQGFSCQASGEGGRAAAGVHSGVCPGWGGAHSAHMEA